MIKEAGGYSEVFYSPVFSFKLMNRSAGFGNAIFSKLPIKKSETIFTRKQHLENFDFDTDDYNIRNLQHIVTEHDGKTLHVLNHHGHHIHSHKKGDDETLRQMKQIGQYIDSLKGAVILTGDFNLEPSSESLGEINRRLTNLSIENKLTTTRTALTHKKEVCDYIFVNKAVKVNHFEASSELVSDHMALILDFDLTA